MHFSLYTTEEPSGETNEPAATLGNLIKTAVAGMVTHLKWFCPATKPTNETTLPFVLYDATTHAELARAVRGSLIADAWNLVPLVTPYSAAANQILLPAVYVQGQYTYTSQGFLTARTVGPLTGLATASDAVGNGRFHTGSDAYPESTYNGNNYWTDFVLVPTSGPKVSVWNGSAELPASVHVWNGTAEVPAVFDSVV